MNVYVGQVYIRPGVKFPFSTRWQQWMTEQLSAVTEPSATFSRAYGADFHVMLNVSADRAIAENSIKGPTVFRGDKGVEYTIFLPFDTITSSEDGCRAAMHHLMAGIRSVLQDVEIDTAQLDARETEIIERACSDPAMLKEPWPRT